MKCDLLLPVWNQLDYTRECIKSLFATVDVPSRLIVIDNASTDGTAEYLRALTPPSMIKLEIITNSSNLGYGGGVNQGLKITDAPFVCILNNDTVFGAGWLSTMLEIQYRENRVGIVNPESSTFGVRPAAGQTMSQLAETLAPRKRDWEELGNCIGFCMLVRRDVLRQIGSFDETFITAFFEDTDFCMRAKKVGFLCVKACGAYVFHHEHKSIEQIPELEKLFAEKGWNATVSRIGSAFCVYFGAGIPADWHALASRHDFDLDRRYRLALIERGIYHFPMPCKQGSISAAHSDEDLARTLEVTREALKTL